MTSSSAGSDIAVRVDVADAGVGVVDTGRASPGAAEHRMSEGIGEQSAAERRRSFATKSVTELGNSPATIDDIEVETSDDDDDNDKQIEKKTRMRLLSKDINEALLGDDLHLDEPLPPTRTTDCSPPEERDRVTTLHSFSPAEDRRHRHRFTPASRYPSLYRCYSTTVDTWSSSRLGGHTPRLRRTSWCSFDEKPIVHPAVDRCRQYDSLPPSVEQLDTQSTQNTKKQADSDQEVGRTPASISRDETAYANMATVYLRDQMRAMFHVADNRLAMKMFGSHNALLKEKQRQKSIGNFVIHPCSKFR